MTTRMAAARACVAELYANAGGQQRMALSHALDEYERATRVYCSNPIDTTDLVDYHGGDARAEYP